jgi:hypothetical protein
VDRVRKEDLVARKPVPVVRYNRVWRFYEVKHGPKVPPSEARTPPRYRPDIPFFKYYPSRPQKSVLLKETPAMPVPDRSKLQLQVRVNFTCGRCHMGGGRPGSSPVVVSQGPTLPNLSVLSRPLPQLPRSPITLPVSPRPPVTLVGLPVMPSPLKLPPIPRSVVGKKYPLLLLPSLTDVAPPINLTPLVPSLPEMPRNHPPTESEIEAAPAPESTLQPPPLPPLPASTLQLPALPKVVPPSAIEEPEPAPPRPLVSRPPPLPPLPQAG